MSGGTDGREATRRAPTLVIATLAMCGTVVSIQGTVVLPLLPEFPLLLETSFDDASWLVTAALLSGAIAMPIVSRLADMFGKKSLILVTLALLVAGSVVGALGSSVAVLIIARTLQGISMALVPIGIAAMRDELPTERVPLGVALMGGTLAIGAGAGLPLAGVVMRYLDWHAIFWVTGVLGAVLLVAVILVLRESPIRTGGSFDFLGAVLLSAALTALFLTLTKGGTWGWTSVPTLSLTAAGIALMGLWAPIEWRARQPLVDLRVAMRPTVALLNVSSILAGVALFINVLVTTHLLQLPTATGFGLGLDVLETGLWMAPSALAFGALTPVSAWLTRRFGAHSALFMGAVIMAASYIARVYLSAHLWQIVLGSVMVSVGISVTYAAIPTLLMRAVPLAETASANGLNTLLRSLGSTVASAGIAAGTSLSVVHVGSGVYPSLHVLLASFAICAALALGMALLAIPLFRLRHADERTEHHLPAADVANHGAMPVIAANVPAAANRVRTTGDPGLAHVQAGRQVPLRHHGGSGECSE
ncbi:MFS transporter [Georgenia sp. AZ-5]|uniref:MFS transporter n=1 Tax=Georgenia sp. AZ-5 TaxID=3367526 RepID=UPI003754836F